MEAGRTSAGFAMVPDQQREIFQLQPGKASGSYFRQLPAARAAAACVAVVMLRASPDSCTRRLQNVPPFVSVHGHKPGQEAAAFSATKTMGCSPSSKRWVDATGQSLLLDLRRLWQQQVLVKPYIPRAQILLEGFTGNGTY